MSETKNLIESIQNNLNEEINPLMQQDFERMLKMNSVDDIYDYLIEITMSQSKNEAIDWLKTMLAYSAKNKYDNITKAICKLLAEFGIHDFKDLFRIDVYESIQNNLNEETTEEPIEGTREREEYWDAKELANENNIYLMKLNTPDVYGRNYVICSEKEIKQYVNYCLKRFSANSDEEALNEFKDYESSLNESEELNPVNKDIEQILNSITTLNNNIQTNEGKEVLDRLVETLANTVNKLGIEIDNDLIG